jgi:hypothetical protein|tara:strand:+ start:1408 stop:1536 length:129 start_codon:yes stop_codon:yes gene_type:complete
MKLILLFLLTAGCAKDYSFNPYSTVLQQLIKSEHLNEEKKKK